MRIYCAACQRRGAGQARAGLADPARGRAACPRRRTTPAAIPGITPIPTCVLWWREAWRRWFPATKATLPAFGGILSPEEIDAVLAYIKSTWPRRERQVPGGAFFRMTLGPGDGRECSSDEDAEGASRCPSGGAPEVRRSQARGGPVSRRRDSSVRIDAAPRPPALSYTRIWVTQFEEVAYRGGGKDPHTPTKDNAFKMYFNYYPPFTPCSFGGS